MSLLLNSKSGKCGRYASPLVSLNVHKQAKSESTRPSIDSDAHTAWLSTYPCAMDWGPWLVMITPLIHSGEDLVNDSVISMDYLRK